MIIVKLVHNCTRVANRIEIIIDPYMSVELLYKCLTASRYLCLRISQAPFRASFGNAQRCGTAWPSAGGVASEVSCTEDLEGSYQRLGYQTCLRAASLG